MHFDGKRLVKNTIFLNLRLVLSLLIGLYTSRVVLQSLGVDDYGLYNLVGGFVSFLCIFTSSITSTARRFLTVCLGEGDFDKLSRTFSTIVFVLLILSAIIGFVGFWGGSAVIGKYLNIPESKLELGAFVFYCSISVFILNVLAVPYVALVTAYEKMDFFAIMGLADSFGKLIIALLLGHTSGSALKFYAIALVILSVLNRVVYGLYCNRNFRESRLKLVFDKTVLKNVTAFSGWMSLGASCGIIKDQSGNILVNLFFGLALNAAMGIANQVKSIITQFSNNIGMAISPQITKCYAAGEIENAFKLTFIMAKCQGLFLLFIAIPFIIETPFILSLWLVNVPSYAVVLTRLSVIVCILNSINMGFGPIFLAEGRIRNYQILSSAIMILYVPVCYFLLKMYPHPSICLLVGVLIEFVLLMTNYICLYVQMKFPLFKFFKDVLFKLILLSVGSTFVSYLVYGAVPRNSVVSLLLVSGVSVFASFLLMYCVVLSKSEKVWAGSFLKKKFHRG